MAEALTITRSFPVDLEAGDGRTILGRCVPFDQPALVCDDPAAGPYREVFKRGAFRRAVRAPHRVLLNYEHQAALGDVIGHAVELEESNAGLEGVFRALPGVPGDQALELIRAGVCRGLSVAAAIPPSGSRMAADGTVERTLATLLHVALVAQPAYSDALISATRHTGELAAGPTIAAVRAQQAHLRLRFRADA